VVHWDGRLNPFTRHAPAFSSVRRRFQAGVPDQRCAWIMKKISKKLLNVGFTSFCCFYAPRWSGRKVIHHKVNDWLQLASVVSMEPRHVHGVAFRSHQCCGAFWKPSQLHNQLYLNQGSLGEHLLATTVLFNKILWDFTETIQRGILALAWRTPKSAAGTFPVNQSKIDRYACFWNQRVRDKTNLLA
jgi:hypothetical protein